MKFISVILILIGFNTKAQNLEIENLGTKVNSTYSELNPTFRPMKKPYILSVQIFLKMQKTFPNHKMFGLHQ